MSWTHRRFPSTGAALLLIAAALGPAACRTATSGDAAGHGDLERRLAACEARVTELEDDDRYLFAEATADLERGWTAAACTRFETLTRRFPSSPLATEAKARIERCRGDGATPLSLPPANAGSSADAPPPAATPSGAPPSPPAAPGESRPTDAATEPAASPDDTPLEITRTWIVEDRFGVPLVNLRLTNRSDRTVVGYKVAMHCYDEHGTALKHLTKPTSWFVAAGGSRQARAGEAFGGGPWPLTGFLGTASVEPVVLSVDYADGSTWTRKDIASLGLDKE